MGITCSNSGFVGYPILLLALPSVASVSLALNMIVENLLVIPVLLVMAERANTGGGESWATYRALLVRLASNPMILAMMAGLAASILELSLPKAFVQTVNMLAASSGAISLLVIGGTLAGLPIGKLGKDVAPIVIGKLIFLPLSVFLVILFIPALGLPAINPTLQMAALLMAAMPMMGIYSTLAQQYGQENFCAVAQLLTTTTSFFTLSGLLWLFKSFPIIG
jgi:predicted permease